MDIGTIPRSGIAVFDEENAFLFFCTRALGPQWAGLWGDLAILGLGGAPKMNFFEVKFLTFCTENMIFSRWCLVNIGTIPRS